MSTNEMEVRQQEAPLSIADLKQQVLLIQQVMKDVMRENEHFGVVPGAKKPSLLKPGAEKLCLTFRLDPQYEIEKEYEYDDQAKAKHLTIISKCVLFHAPSGRRLGSGYGSCSTLETKYAFRNASRKCPTCGKEAIIKGKAEYGGGWLCFKKKEGCGATWPDGSQEIESQEAGKIANEAIADLYNTVLKMANKRSLVAAVLNVTAASDIFTQDIEDMAAKVEAERAKADAKEDPPKGGPRKTSDPTARAFKTSTTTRTQATSNDEDGPGRPQAEGGEGHDPDYLPPSSPGEDEYVGPFDDWKQAIADCATREDVAKLRTEAANTLDNSGFKWLEPHFEAKLKTFNGNGGTGAGNNYLSKIKACTSDKALWAMYKAIPENRKTMEIKRAFEARLAEIKPKGV